MVKTTEFREEKRRGQDRSGELEGQEREGGGMLVSGVKAWAESRKRGRGGEKKRER